MDSSDTQVKYKPSSDSATFKPQHTKVIRDKNIDLKETKDLYGRLMVLVRSIRDADQKHVIGQGLFLHRMGQYCHA